MKPARNLFFRLMVGWWMLCLTVIAVSLPKLLPGPSSAQAGQSQNPVMNLPGPFPGCNAAHAAGFYNIPIGSPAYSPDQDGDGDGLACEPHRGRY